MCITQLGPFGWNFQVALSLYKGRELEVRKNSQVYFAKQIVKQTAPQENTAKVDLLDSSHF